MKVLAVEFLDYAQPPGPIDAPSERVQRLVQGDKMHLSPSDNGVWAQVGDYRSFYPNSVVRRVLYEMDRPG